MTECERIEQATLENQRLQGCICNPTIQVSGGEGFYSGVVAHDRWCPLSPYAAKQEQPSRDVFIVPRQSWLRRWLPSRSRLKIQS